MSRMAHVVNTVSTLMRPKTISKLAAVCIIGRMAYCALDDSKADDDLVKSLREVALVPSDKGTSYDKLFASDKSFQRCHAALTLSHLTLSAGRTHDSVKTSSQSCSSSQDLLVDRLRRDKIDGTKTTVSMAISKRNLFSKQTKQVFCETGLSVEQALAATVAAKR